MRANKKGAWLEGAVKALLMTTTLSGLLSACEGLRPDAFCDEDTPCSQGRVCDVQFGLCQAKPPEITLLSPLAADLIDGGTVRLRGTATDNTKVSDVFYRVGVDAGEWRPLALINNGFDTTLSLPPTDGQKLPISVLARDDFGAEATLTVAPVVDNQPPQFVSSIPEDLARMAAPQLTLKFSEPVRLVAGGLHLSADAGVSTAEFQSEIRVPLQPGTYYAAELAGTSVVDRVGHSLQTTAKSLRFYTAPAAPVHGTEVEFAPSSLDGFQAVSDAEGAVAVVASLKTSEGSILRLGRFHPATGIYEHLNPITTSADKTHRLVNGVWVDFATAKPSRVIGLSQGQAQSPATWSSYWKINDDPLGPGVATDTPAVIPFGPSCAEMGTTPYGLIQLMDNAPAYTRGVGAKTPLEFFPQTLGLRSAEQWELLEVSGGTLRRQFMRTKCTQPPGQEIVFNGSIVQGVLETPAPAVALAQTDRALYLYTRENGQRMERCQQCLYATAEDCKAEGTRPALSADLKISSKNAGGKVLGARKVGDKKVELLERDLGPSCQEAWVSLGFVQTPGPVLDFQPLMFGPKPGVLARYAHRLLVLYP